MLEPHFLPPHPPLISRGRPREWAVRERGGGCEKALGERVGNLGFNLCLPSCCAVLLGAEAGLSVPVFGVLLVPGRDHPRSSCLPPHPPLSPYQVSQQAQTVPAWVPCPAPRPPPHTPPTPPPPHTPLPGSPPCLLLMGWALSSCTPPALKGSSPTLTSLSCLCQFWVCVCANSPIRLTLGSVRGGGLWEQEGTQQGSGGGVGRG